MVKKIKLSVVVPAYNEEKIIRDTLKAITGYLSDQKYSWEVVVSNDGSSDATSKLVKELKNKNIRLVDSFQNQGKGAALKKGMLAAKGEYVIFMDADLSVPLENINKFLDILEHDGGVTIASRRVKGAEIVVHQPVIRETMGRVFTFITRLIAAYEIVDFTCGFKGFTKESAQTVFSKSLIKRWAYDAEILFLAKKFGFPIKQLPVVWKNREDTRVRLNKVILETFIDLLKIRYFDFKGRYED